MNHIESGVEPVTKQFSLEFGSIVDQLESNSSSPMGNAAAPLSRIRGKEAEVRKLHAKVEGRLSRIGVPAHIVTAAITRSKTTGATFVHELFSSGHLDPHEYYTLLAADLGIPFVTSINPDRVLSDLTAAHIRPGRTALVCCRNHNAQLVIHIAPDLRSENQLTALLAKTPIMRSNFCICEPKTIRDAMERKHEQHDVDNAVSKLHRRWPHLSAKETLIPWQAFVLGVFLSLFPLSLWISFWPTLFAVHLIAILLFGSSVAIRIAAWRSLRRQVPAVNEAAVNATPIYSVLVALHKEAAVIPQLVRAMARLDWPASRLEVIYACEADDSETISALGQIHLPGPHRIVCVPPSHPRTKPKALNYALERCSGEFVVIYDAEDRPHPQQLREAWARFCSEPEDLACLQAPLDIANFEQSWLSKMFAFEYAAHFHGLLPYLNRIGVPLPLGGTSNHFRRDALLDVLGWDPYNVTEDADLGIRLYRGGYRCGLLFHPTLEDAPTVLREWLPQRTRWIKGWMQTFLVHSRDHRSLIISIGNYKNLILQILMIGFILSPLLYAVSILEIFYFIVTFSESSNISKFIIYFDIAIMAFGHIGYALLALSCWQRVSSRPAAAIAAQLPFYWLLASIAAWRAVWKLLTVPHQWEKTTHHAAFKQNPTGTHRATL